MAHLNSAEGIQNMCATQIMTKSKSLRTGFSSQVGALDQGLISCFQNASQTLISSRPNPTKKLEENPVPLPEEWLPFPPTPALGFFFFFLITVNYSKNIVQITACPPY